MKRIAITLALVFLLSSIATVFAADKAATFEGKLVDSKCYLEDTAKNTGNDHSGMKGCGTMCLKAGTPGALLTKDNKFYALLAPSIALAPYVGENIRVTGTLHGTALQADKVEVNKDGKWVSVDIGGMM
ncbi:MAG: hypothetical protein ACRD4K_09205 [Candidatus Acidiferrales bacterium]